MSKTWDGGKGADLEFVRYKKGLRMLRITSRN